MGSEAGAGRDMTRLNLAPTASPRRRSRSTRWPPIKTVSCTLSAVHCMHQSSATYRTVVILASNPRDLYQCRGVLALHPPGHSFVPFSSSRQAIAAWNYDTFPRASFAWPPRRCVRNQNLAGCHSSNSNKSCCDLDSIQLSSTLLCTKVADRSSPIRRPLVTRRLGQQYES